MAAVLLEGVLDPKSQDMVKTNNLDKMTLQSKMVFGVHETKMDQNVEISPTSYRGLSGPSGPIIPGSIPKS